MEGRRSAAVGTISLEECHFDSKVHSPADWEKVMNATFRLASDGVLPAAAWTVGLRGDRDRYAKSCTWVKEAGMCLGGDHRRGYGRWGGKLSFRLILRVVAQKAVTEAAQNQANESL